MNRARREGSASVAALFDSPTLLSLTVSDYDAVTLSPLPVSPPAFHTTVYPVSNQAILDAVQELVRDLKSRKYYTDTANFDLRCGVCGVGLKGERGAREHAMQTGRMCPS